MSRINGWQCDGSGCNALSYDLARDKWIRFFGMLNRYKLNESHGIADTFLRAAESSTPMHYCSWACFDKGRGE